MLVLAQVPCARFFFTLVVLYTHLLKLYLCRTTANQWDGQEIIYCTDIVCPTSRELTVEVMFSFLWCIYVLKRINIEVIIILSTSAMICVKVWKIRSVLLKNSQFSFWYAMAKVTKTKTSKSKQTKTPAHKRKTSTPVKAKANHVLENLLLSPIKPNRATARNTPKTPNNKTLKRKISSSTNSVKRPASKSKNKLNANKTTSFQIPVRPIMTRSQFKRRTGGRVGRGATSDASSKQEKQG